jgi:alpha-beta hydrolase superfamily lysophospholipase
MTWHVLLIALAVPATAFAQTRVTFRTPDGASIEADEYGAGNRAVVLIGHGGYSSRASWRDEARTLGNAGYRVLVFDTRAAVDLAKGNETACLYDEACMAVDVLAAVRHMRQAGAKTVAVIGGSAGGGAAAQASVDASPGEIDKVVLLAPMTIKSPERIKASAFYATSRDDLGSDDKPRLPGIRQQYENTPEPKQWLVLEGSAHGQRIFGTSQGKRLRAEILRFLSTP